MEISLIWAMDRNGLIGVNNRLPWQLPADMRWFRQHTLGKPVVMGRKTFDSFGGRPLPKRTNVVVTTNQNYAPEVNGDLVVVHSIAEALAAVESAPEVMVIGGSSFYRQLLPQADRLYVTVVDGTFNGDAWFPEVAWEAWQKVEDLSHAEDADNPYAMNFAIYRRKGSPANIK
ncbi:MAG: dihydrofolate reductase [Gammaproteobacteria bacterium]|nr:dihydrofolate reductase [Gammaproteobacteria bacterium]